MLITSLLSISSTFTLTIINNSWELIIITTIWLINIIFITTPLSPYAQNITNNFSLDSLSLLIILLCIWVTQLIIIASYYINNNNNPNFFNFLCIALIIALILCFSTNNLIIFYSLFELSLVPVLLLINYWGYQPERNTASIYIIIYTVSASLPILLIILNLISINYTLNFIMTTTNIPFTINLSMTWFILILAFMVKLPLFSAHIWLPNAHVEAPVAGSIILAAILLNLGGYGMTRINNFINQSLSFNSTVLICIAVTGGIITNTLCIRQTDLNALIAYSSIGHMAILVIGCFSNSNLGQYGVLAIIISHGLSSSCIFILTDNLYNNFQSRSIILINTSIDIQPSSSLAWTFAITSNIALPPNLNILSEILIIISSFFILPNIISLIIISSLSTAAYSIYLYSIINHGPLPYISNPTTSINSITLTSSVSHMCPLLILISVPTSLINWC